MRSCPHCGPNPVIHTIEWFSAFTSWLCRPFYQGINVLWKKIAPFFFFLNSEKAGEKVLRALTRLHMGKLVSQISEKDGGRARVMWEEARQRGIAIQEYWLLGHPRELFIAHYKDQTRVFESLPRPQGAESPAMDWMDNKGLMQKKFLAAGFPVPRGRACFSFHEAVRLLKELGGPVITKPNLGSRSRHTTIHIRAKSQLAEGFRIAKQLSPWVMVEEELQGFVHRVTLVGGRVAGVLRREPPEIIGDGIHTVHQLVLRENKNPKRQGPLFHHLPKGPETDAELARQKVTWESVPAAGTIITLHPRIGRGDGASNTEVTDTVHPENSKLFERIAAFLNDPLVGIDFIIKDMRQPWHEQMPCGAIECNSMPFIDLHHHPMRGKPRNVAGMLWDIAIPQSRFGIK